MAHRLTQKPITDVRRYSDAHLCNVHYSPRAVSAKVIFDEAETRRDRREARKRVERCGFRIRDLRVGHAFPHRIQDYVEYRYVKEPPFRWMPEPLFWCMERFVGSHLPVYAEGST